MKNLRRSASLVTLLIVGLMPVVMAQQPLQIRKSVPYYIDINHAEKSDIYEIHDGLLSLQYDDKYGQQKNIQLKLYNWKLEQAGTFTLDKAFGLNNYNIELNNTILLEDGLNYLCVLTDEGGIRHEWNIRQSPLVKTDLEVDIFVNPLSIECEAAEGNMVEYYGQIRNGRGPYTMQWYILNDSRTDFLYQPREEQLNDPGKTSAVRVDKTPDYYVVLDVKDACGATGRKMVFMTCEGKKKLINTIFAEPLQLPPAQLKTGN